MNLRSLLRTRPYFPLLLLITLILAACGGTTVSEPTASEEMTDMEDMEEMDHDDLDHEVARVPNEGAAIQITAPNDGDTFSASEQVIVEVETENFDLTEEGYHWHVYVDGGSWGMVTGGNQDQPLTGLEPGKHLIEVYLSISSHEELEDGDSIMIVVTE